MDGVRIKLADGRQRKLDTGCSDTEGYIKVTEEEEEQAAGLATVG